MKRGDIIRKEDGVYFFDGVNLILARQDFNKTIIPPKEFAFPEFNLEYFNNINEDYILVNFQPAYFDFSKIKLCKRYNLFFFQKEGNLRPSKVDDKYSLMEFTTFNYQNKTYYIANLGVENIRLRTLLKQPVIRLSYELLNEDGEVLISAPHQDHLFFVNFTNF